MATTNPFSAPITVPPTALAIAPSADSSMTATGYNYQALTVKELRALSTSRNFKGASGLPKKELIPVHQKYDAMYSTVEGYVPPPPPKSATPSVAAPGSPFAAAATSSTAYTGDDWTKDALLARATQLKLKGLTAKNKASIRLAILAAEARTGGEDYTGAQWLRDRLQQRAEELGLTGLSNKSKPYIIAAILAAERAPPAAPGPLKPSAALMSPFGAPPVAAFGGGSPFAAPAVPLPPAEMPFSEKSPNAVHLGTVGWDGGVLVVADPQAFYKAVVNHLQRGGYLEQGHEDDTTFTEQLILSSGSPSIFVLNGFGGDGSRDIYVEREKDPETGEEVQGMDGRILLV